MADVIFRCVVWCFLAVSSFLLLAVISIFVYRFNRKVKKFRDTFMGS